MKSHNIQSDMSTIKRAFIFSLSFFLLFNTSIIIYRYGYFKGGNGLAIVELLKESIYIIIMLTCSFLGFSINNILFKTYALFMFVTGALASYFTYSMNILPTKQIVKSFFDVESVEAYELVSLKLVIWVIISIYACLYLLRKYDAKPSSSKLSTVTMFMLFILSIANIITPFYKIFTNYMPINYLHNSYHYFLDRFAGVDMMDFTLNHQFKNQDNDDVKAILVIGESARSDHFALGSYSRDTNPLLSKKKASTSPQQSLA